MGRVQKAMSTQNHASISPAPDIEVLFRVDKIISKCSRCHMYTGLVIILKTGHEKDNYH
jgi:hypothetical protein